MGVLNLVYRDSSFNTWLTFNLLNIFIIVDGNIYLKGNSRAQIYSSILYLQTNFALLVTDNKMSY